MTRVLTAPEAYERWAESFDTSASPIVALEARHLQRVLPDVRGKRLIDVGCGTGPWLAWALARGARATGADPSAAMLRLAARQPDIAGRNGRADALRLPLA